MNRASLVIAAMAALALGTSGAVVAGGQQQAPAQDARPASDPVADALRATPEESAPVVAPTPNATPTNAVPSSAAAPIIVQMDDQTATVADPEVAQDVAKAVAAKPPATPALPGTRQRRRVAIIEAIDKITAERMRFEVEVGGRPVRFNKSLIFSAKACEVSATDERVQDAIAYLDISLQSRPTNKASETRRIFQGWMFASTPAVSGIENSLYDAWVVGCKA